MPLGVDTPGSPGAAKVTLRTTGGLTNEAAFAVAAPGVGGRINSSGAPTWPATTVPAGAVGVVAAGNIASS